MAARTAQTEPIDRLEEALMEMAYQSMKTEGELARISRKMRESKDENLSARHAMDRQLTECKDQRLAFQAQERVPGRGFDRQGGNPANRMGTRGEDIAASAPPSASRTAFGFDATTVSVHRRPQIDRRAREDDEIAVAAGRGFGSGVKSTYRRECLTGFAGVPADFPLFIPEDKATALITAMSALHSSEQIIHLPASGIRLAPRLCGGYPESVNAGWITMA